MTSSPYASSALDAPAVDVDQLEDVDVDQVAVTPPPAGTPLSALATTPADDDAAGQGSPVQRLSARVELEGGQVLEALITNRDFVAWDKTRPGRKWPAAEDAPFLLNTFLAFCALKRTGQWTGRFEDFEAQADVVDVRKADPARPTR